MRVIEWILDNLFVVFIIAGVLAQLLQAIRKKGQGDEEDVPPVPRHGEFEDPELAERTRRIREDIQRRIAERQRGGAPAPVAPNPYETEPAGYEEPPPLVREVVVERPAPPPLRVPAPAGYGSRMEAHRAAEILEQQAALADRLRQAEEMKAAALRRAAFEAKTDSPQAKQRQQRRGALLQDLRNPDALRRAFVLREVLGPPVGLR